FQYMLCQLLRLSSIFLSLLKVDKAYIGIENNKKDAIEHLTQLTEKHNSNIEIVALKIKYPQGGEKQLIKAITKKEVPSGGLPIHVGVVVQNVGTTFAVYEAIQKNKPLFERIVTITGKSVKNPGDYLTRIGTPINNLIEIAGGLPEDTGKIIGGGPMMGKALSSTKVTITKGSSGVLIMPKEESYRSEIMPCIKCSKCVGVCPQGLEPYLLMTLSEHQKWEMAHEQHSLDCIECGSCSYICPSNRPLLDYIRYEKQNVGAMLKARSKK
ncbi:MAG: RnfABCDGE type electron transport complex subunit C, partial [Bacteroidota bacterium]|nr:RnfABCDGE type electron transport complex subunit C [Bacteroidota bacterium]